MSLAVLADHMASKGRGPDSMLIHMSPREVQGLQALAMKHGGSLTINPDTGLPEAGFLDKLLPAIIGVGLSMAGVPPNVAAMLVGGAQTIRTGDIGKGISAGLGAYGGAGLGAGMSAAGASSIGGQGAGLAGDMAFNLADAGSSFSNALPGGETGILNSSALSDETVKGIQQQAANRVAETSPFDKIAKGFDAVKANPMGYANADNFKYMAAAAAPILADQAVKSNLPTTTTKPGMIRPYSYDPYSGTYTAGNPYEAQVKKAADGGVMGFDESANSPMSQRNLDGMQNTGGMFNYAHDGGGVMKMAEGGIAGYAIGGDTKAAIDAAYAAGDYSKVNELAQANKITAADVADTYKGFDTSGLAGLGINLFTPPAQQAAPVAQAAAAPAYTSYTPEQIGQWFADNKGATNEQVQTAIRDTKVDPNAVNQYIASLDNPFRGSTETDRGSGTLGIYNQMIARGIDPNELYAANLAIDPKYAGWTKDMIQQGYNLDKGMYALSDAKKGTVTDTDWAKLMVGNGTWDKPQYDPNAMAQATGLSIAEVRARFELEKLKANPTIKTVTNTVTGTGGAGATIPTYTRDGTGTGGSLETVTGLPPGVSGAGITTVNPNGTITTRPNIPGIPVGGFTGMTDVRNAYTTGGGSLGYTPYVPTSIEDFNAKYNKLTGGSKQSYDYLTGKTPYSPTPYTPTGEVMKPYAESVLGMPANVSKKMYLFDPVTKQYKINPDYAIPTYDAKGNKVYNVTNKDVIAQMATKPSASDFYTWAKTNNLSVEQIAAATGMPITEIQKLFSGGAPADTSTAGTTGNASSESSSGTGGQAEGGLAALTMARGGATHQPFFSKSTGKFTSRAPQVYADGGAAQFNLGGYSDGGRLLKGPGDGVSDSIPATIGNKQPARLADGEFVVPARIVSELGNGSTEAGARKLYAMMDRVQAARKGSIGKGKVAKNSRADKYLPA